MSRYPYMPLFCDAYMSDTIHLDMRESGCYLQLLMVSWKRPNCDLPDDDAFLAKVCRIDVRTWKRSIRPSLESFFTIEDGVWTQKRLQKERGFLNTKSMAQASNASARWGENLERVNRTNRAARMAEARRKGTHTSEEWASLLNECGNKCLKCGSTDRIVKDHIVPIYQGGSDKIENLQPLCARCNSGKGSDTTNYVIEMIASRSLPNASQTPPPTPIPIKEEKKESSLRSPKKESDASPSAQPARGKRITPDWQPSERNTHDAEAIGFVNGEIVRLAEEFRDYWIAKPGKDGVKLDWDATWRTWCRNDKKFSNKKRDGPKHDEPYICNKSKMLIRLAEKGWEF